MKRIFVLCLFCLTGCFGSSKPTRYYLLSANSEGGRQGPQAVDQRVILVGPVELAKYLDRSNMVSRVGMNELLVSDFDSWAEDLDRGIASTIAANLSRKENLASCMFVSRPNLVSPDLEMPLLIEQFDCDDKGICRAEAFSSLKFANGEQVLPLARHQFTQAIHGSMANEQAEVLSVLVAEISQAISDRVASNCINRIEGSK